MKSSKLSNVTTFFQLTLLFLISDIEDVNKAFRDMHEEVEQKVYRADFETSLQSQQQLNEVLCQENCSARWVWRSGKLS